jgi:hypothetical protein
MNQLTVRGFDKALERRLREIARARGVSLNQAALILMRQGAGLGRADRQARAVGPSLDHLIGSWSEDEERQFLDAIGALEEVDQELWR